MRAVLKPKPTQIKALKAIDDAGCTCYEVSRLIDKTIAQTHTAMMDLMRNGYIENCASTSDKQRLGPDTNKTSGAVYTLKNKGRIFRRESH